MLAAAARPGGLSARAKLWAPAISVTQLVGGPLLALGLFTRLVAVPIVLFLLVSNVERWRVGGYFWNQLGLEYTLMWTVAALYFLVHGGGAYLARPSSSAGNSDLAGLPERLMPEIVRHGRPNA